MSRTLTLIRTGWESAQLAAQSGRRAVALNQVNRLLARPDLPVALAAEANQLAAELELEAEHYPAARRHLRASTSLTPANARIHYLAGLAFERDPAGDDRRAALRFRLACRLEPDNRLYRAAFGRAAVRCNHDRIGVKALLATANTDDAEVLTIVVEGLLEAGRVQSARRVVQAARFRRPRCATIRALTERVRFAAARRGQAAQRVHEARRATDGDRRTLPFIRVVSDAEGHSSSVGFIRGDVLSLPRPHLARFRSTDADR